MKNIGVLIAKLVIWLSVLAFFVAGFRFMYIRYELLPKVADDYMCYLFPMLVSIGLLFLLWKDLSRIKVLGRVLACLLTCLIGTFIFLNVILSVNYAMRKVVELPTIDNSNLPEVLNADYILVDSISIRKDDVGGFIDSFTTEDQNAPEKNILYQVCALDNVLNVCLGSHTIMEGESYESLSELDLKNLCLHRVKPSQNLDAYILAGETCNNAVFVHRTADAHLTVLEISSIDNIKVGESAITCILVAACVLVILLILLSFIFGSTACSKTHPLIETIRFLACRDHIITWALPVLWVIGFLVEMLHGYNPFSSNLILLINNGAIFTPFVLEGGEYWRLLTYGFLHDGIIHLASNILFFIYLSIFRPAIDGLDSMARIKRVLVIYFVGTILSGLWCTLTEELVLVGASGGIFALHGSLLARYLFIPKEDRRHFMKEYLILFLLMIQNILASFTPGVSLAGHLAGLVVGFLLEAGIEGYARYREECC